MKNNQSKFKSLLVKKKLNKKSVKTQTLTGLVAIHLVI